LFTSADYALCEQARVNRRERRWAGLSPFLLHTVWITLCQWCQTGSCQLWVLLEQTKQQQNIANWQMIALTIGTLSFVMLPPWPIWFPTILLGCFLTINAYCFYWIWFLFVLVVACSRLSLVDFHRTDSIRHFRVCPLMIRLFWSTFSDHSTFIVFYFTFINITVGTLLLFCILITFSFKHFTHISPHIDWVVIHVDVQCDSNLFALD
jgi:hypothetical protein